jgi:hypothetical protein
MVLLFSTMLLKSLTYALTREDLTMAVQIESAVFQLSIGPNIDLLYLVF